MPKGRVPTIVGEQLEQLLYLRDVEGHSFDHIARITGIERSTVSNTWHRHHNTKQYQDQRERRLARQAEIAEAKAANGFGHREMNKLLRKEFEGADVRRLWKVLQGTSKLGGRL